MTEDGVPLYVSIIFLHDLNSSVYPQLAKIPFLNPEKKVTKSGSGQLRPWFLIVKEPVRGQTNG